MTKITGVATVRHNPTKISKLLTKLNLNYALSKEGKSTLAVCHPNYRLGRTETKEIIHPIGAQYNTPKNAFKGKKKKLERDM